MFVVPTLTSSLSIRPREFDSVCPRQQRRCPWNKQSTFFHAYRDKARLPTSGTTVTYSRSPKLWKATEHESSEILLLSSTISSLKFEHYWAKTWLIDVRVNSQPDGVVCTWEWAWVRKNKEKQKRKRKKNSHPGECGWRRKIFFLLEGASHYRHISTCTEIQDSCTSV